MRRVIVNLWTLRLRIRVRASLVRLTVSVRVPLTVRSVRRPTIGERRCSRRRVAALTVSWAPSAHASLQVTLNDTLPLAPVRGSTSVGVAFLTVAGGGVGPTGGAGGAAGPLTVTAADALPAPPTQSSAVTVAVRVPAAS